MLVSIAATPGPVQVQAAILRPNDVTDPDLPIQHRESLLPVRNMNVPITDLVVSAIILLIITR